MREISLSAEKDLSWFRRRLDSLRTVLRTKIEIDLGVLALLFFEARLVGVFFFDSRIGLLDRLVGLALYCLCFFLVLKFYQLLEKELPEPEESSVN